MSSPGEERGERWGSGERGLRQNRGKPALRPCAASHLVTKGREVPLEALVLALQGLDTGQVVAIVVCV